MNIETALSIAVYFFSAIGMLVGIVVCIVVFYALTETKAKCCKDHDSDCDQCRNCPHRKQS